MQEKQSEIDARDTKIIKLQKQNDDMKALLQKQKKTH